MVLKLLRVKATPPKRLPLPHHSNLKLPQSLLQVRASPPLISPKGPSLQSLKPVLNVVLSQNRKRRSVASLQFPYVLVMLLYGLLHDLHKPRNSVKLITVLLLLVRQLVEDRKPPLSDIIMCHAKFSQWIARLKTA